MKTSPHQLEAVKTYVEQTKLLVTLASAFIVAPAVATVTLASVSFCLFTLAESMFVLSVLMGYLVFGSLAGSQDAGDYDVYRPATRISSLLQVCLFLGGLVCFFILVWTGVHADVATTSSLSGATL